MSMITPANSDSALETQQKEIRALAIQAAATLFASRKFTSPIPAINSVLSNARTIETYITEGRIPSDES
jgi:hypothetical protein